MMTNSLPEAFAIALISFVAGVVVGQFVRFRREPADGKSVLVPEIDRRPFRGKWFRLMVVALFLASTGLLVQFTVQQRECNDEFRRTIAERADISVDDNRARKAADRAVAELARGFLSIPEDAPDRQARARVLLERFDTTVTVQEQRQNDNEALRAANPYPRC